MKLNTLRGTKCAFNLGRTSIPVFFYIGVPPGKGGEGVCFLGDVADVLVGWLRQTPLKNRLGIDLFVCLFVNPSSAKASQAHSAKNEIANLNKKKSDISLWKSLSSYQKFYTFDLQAKTYSPQNCY